MLAIFCKKFELVLEGFALPEGGVHLNLRVYEGLEVTWRSLKEESAEPFRQHGPVPKV